jgi:hypothetical protein
MNWYKKSQNIGNQGFSFEEEAMRYNNPEDFIASLGEPFHHGTSSEFEEFDIERAGTVKKSDWGKGIYLVRSHSGADYYRIEAVKNNDTQYNDLYNKYRDIEKNLPPVSDTNSTPAYTEKAYEALRNFQNRGDELNKDTTSGRIVEIYISPQAKIMRYESESGMTDPFLAEHALYKGFDAILVDEGRYMEELVVVNPAVIKTREQLINIWNNTHANSVQAKSYGIKGVYK